MFLFCLSILAALTRQLSQRESLRGEGKRHLYNQKKAPGTMRNVPGAFAIRRQAELCGKLRLRGWLVFHQVAVVCLHQQQGGLFGLTVGEVEHLAAAALCQQVVDGKAAGLTIGDELDGLRAVVL